MKCSRTAFVCIFVLILSVTSQAVAGEGYYDTGGVGLRDDRSDCNGNGTADEDEMRPLDGHALVFDGSGDYVDPGASTALANLGQGDFTIEAWIRTDHPGGGVLVSNAKNTSALYNFVVLGDDDEGRIRLRIKNGATSYTCTSSVRINDGHWHHVAASRWMSGAGSIRLYVDGEECAMLWGNYDMEPFTADYPTLIGRDQYASPHYFTGAMDEVRVWNVGRYSGDIQADMYRVLNGDEEGLVAYWRFDEGAGSVAYDSVGSSDGTLVGSPMWAPFDTDCNNNGVLDECDMVVDGVLYVDDDATSGLNDGFSWANAFVDLQDALAFAECGSRVTEIRVAGGTYKPGTDRDDSFRLVNGLALRGGYRGLAGGGDPDDRDIDAFESILSGNIGAINDPDDNSVHVVVAVAVDESTLLEGFTITEGYADDDYGGGAYISSASSTIARCKFVNNRARLGGGMCVGGTASPTLDRCTFSGNSASNDGGGMYFYGAVIYPPIMMNCTFSGNSASREGGGMYTNSFAVSQILMNCTFSGNSATGDGGGLYRRMGRIALVNCTLTGNSAGSYGGGCCSFSAAGIMECKNCIIWGNTADVVSQAFRPDVYYSCVQGGYSGTGNIDADPLFVDADGPDDIYGTEDDDLHLQEGSPCINAGNDGSIPSDVTTDFDGEPRVQQCHVDMGVDETPFLRNDCNNNGIDDKCDIEAGTSLDEDGDGVPDECPPYGDCDHDLDVDLDDYGEMLSCMLGADVDAGGDCDCFDGDGDSDVDLKDFAIFQQAFTGPL